MGCHDEDKDGGEFLGEFYCKLWNMGLYRITFMLVIR